MTKEINEELKKMGDTPYSWIERLSIKMSVFPNLIFRFNTILITIPASLSTNRH